MARGGARPGAGRPKGPPRIPQWRGDPNYLELEAIAQNNSLEILQVVLDIALNGENENARLAACSTILDRAWGKARQSHKHQHHMHHEGVIGHMEVGGQVDLRRLSDDELRDLELLLDRATVPATIEATVSRRPAIIS